MGLCQFYGVSSMEWAQIICNNYKSTFNCIIEGSTLASLWEVSLMVDMKFKYHTNDDVVATLEVALRHVDIVS